MQRQIGIYIQQEAVYGFYPEYNSTTPSLDVSEIT